MKSLSAPIVDTGYFHVDDIFANKVYVKKYTIIHDTSYSFLVENCMSYDNVLSDSDSDSD